MIHVSEIAPDVFRFSTYNAEGNLQFNQFLVRDEEPLLFHTGLRRLFPSIRDAVARVIEPSSLRWIGFSHFEADECGSLGDWQTHAPRAEAICSMVGKLVSVDDVALRPARGLVDGDVIPTGRYRFRFIQTPHVPHGWDAGFLFEETHKTLLCSDLFHQNGDVEAQTRSDVVGRFKQTLIEYQRGPLAGYMPYTPQTNAALERLAALEPRTLATMHGSTYVGDGGKAIRELGAAWKEVMSTP